MAGRRPFPTALHEIRGDPGDRGKQALVERKAFEPTTELDTLAPPSDLSPNQRELWVESIQHAPPGVLRRIDAQVLKAWVIACDTHSRAAVQVSQGGLLHRIRVRNQPKNWPEGKEEPPEHFQFVQNPYVKVMNQQALLMFRGADQLGFSPTSRPKLYVAGAAAAMAGEALTMGRPRDSLEAWFEASPQIEGTVSK